MQMTEFGLANVPDVGGDLYGDEGLVAQDLLRSDATGPSDKQAAAIHIAQAALDVPTQATLNLRAEVAKIRPLTRAGAMAMREAARAPIYP